MNIRYLLWILTFLSIVVVWHVAYSASNVAISAIVWNQNQPPLILAVAPDSDPLVLARSSTQNYNINIKDNEGDTVYYTLTAASWSTIPLNWSITDSTALQNWEAYVSFTYVAPSSPPAGSFTTVTLTLNDGPNLVPRVLNLYIY